MTTENIIFLSLGILIIISFLIIILYKYFNEKLSLLLNKINMSGDDYIKKINIKIDLLNKMVDIIKKDYKIESKTFNDIKNINVDSIEGFKDEKLLNKCFREIEKAMDDNKYVIPTKEEKKSKKKKQNNENKEDNKLKNLLKKYNENDLKIIALRTYYNVYTLEFNNVIKKFPYSIISKLKKYSLKNILEGKEIDINFNNDLEV